MRKKIVRFELRFSEEEMEKVKAESVKFGSVSNYIRSAVAEFSDCSVRDRLSILLEFTELLKKHQNELSWMGSNLNQAVKHANELAKVGLMTDSYLKEVILPAIEPVVKLLYEIKSDESIIISKLKILK